MGYNESGLAGASCPAGWTMGHGYEQHDECEYCNNMCHRLCGNLASGGKRKATTEMKR